MRVLYWPQSDRKYQGKTATTICLKLQQHAVFGSTKTVNEYVNRVAKNYGRALKGRTTEKRCECFLQKMVAWGFVFLVDKGSRDDQRFSAIMRRKGTFSIFRK